MRERRQRLDYCTSDTCGLIAKEIGQNITSPRHETNKFERAAGMFSWAGATVTGEEGKPLSGLAVRHQLQTTALPHLNGMPLHYSE